MKNNKPYATLRGGVLLDCFQKVRRNYYDAIDAEVHKSAYYGPHGLMCAELEFAGKYLDLCAHYYEMEGDERAKERAFTVIDGIEENIREDGHITCYPPGHETDTFSIWNHNMAIYGLCRVAEATGDARAKALAVRAADFLVHLFTKENPPSLLSELNQGSQHISLLYAMVKMTCLTGEERYLNFIRYVLEWCEGTDMNLLTFDDILTIRSRKGIEMLVIYLGVLSYGRLTGDEQAIDAARRYWRQLQDTQIRNTGNGTIGEFWSENGNAHSILPTDTHPNETCVAVGWSELSLALLHHEPRAEYADELERTLYNHMLDSFDESGRDFAYYQGNCGQKEFRKPEGSYQCCRYRGYTLFSYLPSFVFYDQGDTLIPVLYSEADYEKDGLSIRETTAYPKNGTVHFAIRNERETCRLLLRIPHWCDCHTVTVDGIVQDLKREENGFLALPLPMGDCSVTLELFPRLTVEEVEIEGEPYLTYHYGPLLLALDTHFGGALDTPLTKDAIFERVEDEGSLIHLRSGDVHLVDFGSAGRKDPENDCYTVYIKKQL